MFCAKKVTTLPDLTVTVKKEDTVNSVQLKYLQKLVGKDWNVEMHVSLSREAIHCRQPRIQAGRSSTQRACPVHRQACPVHRQASPVHRQAG